MEHASAVDGLEKSLCGLLILGDDGFRMTRAVRLDVPQSGVHAVYDLKGYPQVSCRRGRRK